MIDKYQKKQLENLRNANCNEYDEASLYTILLDLCEGNGIEDVYEVLEDVVKDIEE